MFFVAIFVVLVSGVTLIVLLRRPPPPVPRQPTPPATKPSATAPTTTTEPNAQTLTEAPKKRQPPPEMAGFRVIDASELDADSQQAMLSAFKDVPRPPKLLHQLLSPNFLQRASSAELADLIAAEPLIATRVLRTVNSPQYGVKSPVQSIEKAVNLLGLNTVRSICMLYLLVATLQADGPERQQVLDQTWRASGLASELLQRLAAKLELPDRGALVSALVLSFLGRLATAATVPRELLADLPAHSYLDRCKAEQALIGLTSPEVGRLLMRHWSLPPSIVDEAADAGRVLPAPGTQKDPVQMNRNALCYLCARVSERLAGGQLASLSQLDFLDEEDADFYRLQTGLNESLLARAGQALRSPEMQALASRMLQPEGSAARQRATVS